ncbi:superoxide dismutase [Novosphingobium sp. Chol11]|uniref:superoxide dismutase n=1 Tax=Novosphingobium sp. Chol11 TaxID=1385763 RepID=UPI0025DB37B7|nr:superoxide dismutase [Novosphingobium sp. Chol11]
MSIELPPLPFADDALEPHLSAHALMLHHDKHHANYVAKLNALVENGPLAALPLEEIIHASEDDLARKDIYNNAAQAWNHAFFWNSLSADGADRPGGSLAAAIDKDFGSLAAFKEAFTKVAVGAFGSGWIWLVSEAGKLAIIKTSNAETPVGSHRVPLATLDVWEHAYYVDYENRRPAYVKAFLDKLINWNFAARNLDMALVA